MKVIPFFIIFVRTNIDTMTTKRKITKEEHLRRFKSFEICNPNKGQVLTISEAGYIIGGRVNKEKYLNGDIDTFFCYKCNSYHN